MDVWSFVLILILMIAMIPFAILDLFRDPEEIARRVAEIEKFELRYH